MPSPLVIEKSRCATCKKYVKNNAVECNWCKKWEHKVCANLSDGDYILLGSSSDSVKFYCSYCAPSLAWPDPIPRRGVIAFSISAPLGKGSGTLHSAHS